MARLIASQTGKEMASVLQEHRQSVCTFLRRMNARAIFSRSLGCNPGAPTPGASALAALDGF